MGRLTCPFCGEPLEYLGIDDGGGLYGTSLVELWSCDECGMIEDEWRDIGPNDSLWSEAEGGVGGP